MVSKIKKSIVNSKNKAGFNKRQTGRVERKHKREDAESKTYVDRKEMKKEKRAKRDARKE